MRVSPEDDPTEGSRDFKYNEEMYEVQQEFDEEGNRVLGGGGQAGRSQLPEPHMWVVFFGEPQLLIYQTVHAEAVIDRHPRFAQRFSDNQFTTEAAPPSAQAAFIEFLYSGNFWLPNGTVDYPDRSFQADFELAVHMYSLSQITRFPELESQAINQIMRIGNLLTEKETLAILALKIRPEFPEIRTDGWLDLYLHRRRHQYLTKLQHDERVQARKAKAEAEKGTEA